MADPRGAAGGRRRRAGRRRAASAAAGLAPLAAVALMAAYLLGPATDALDLGTALPELSIEQVRFVDGEIRADVRNTGPVPVEVAVADVNDRIHPAAIEPDRRLERLEAAVVRIPFDWNAGEPYRIGVTVDDGTRFERAVEAASPAPEPTAELFGAFALVGAYVGVVPVLVGMLWLPFIARMRGGAYILLLSFTAGLLLFLGIDALEEAAAVSAESLAGGLNGLLLIATVAAASFLALHAVAGRMRGGAAEAEAAAEEGRGGAPSAAAASAAAPVRPMAMALMISVGIGLHNFGEGLAIGAAVVLGQAALGAFLIVGFALHNTTEGVAIAAPVAGAARRREGEEGLAGAARAGARLVPRLAALGAIAGAPAILGAWIGGFAYSPIAAIVLLSVGIGAIFQVALAVLAWARSAGAREGRGAFPGAPAAAGVASGMAVMYLTSILV